jgi:CubicO group peptidase (beta-lactamase class C family)
MSPESQGVSSAAILAFLDEADAAVENLHSFMLLRRGAVLAEGWWSPYTPEHPHLLFSISKSFASTAVGLAVAEGYLSVDDPVISFFPDDVPARVSPNLAAMRVRHLLSMVTGHPKDTTERFFTCKDGNWAKAFLRAPVEHEPGTHFVYNSGATYMLSAIVQKLTGQTLIDYLRPRILEPLGIEGAWDSCPRGINIGGWGLSVRTEAIARFGQMYLQKGIWNGERLLPESWVEAATSPQVKNGSNPESDWEQGYGYQFWRCRYGAYRGDGVFGQFCIVLPKQEAVIAITAGISDMQQVLNLVWKHLLHAMGDEVLEENLAAQDELAQRLSGLAIKPVKALKYSPVEKNIDGRTILFAKNRAGLESVTIHFQDDCCTFIQRDILGEHRANFGREEWLEGATSFESRGIRPTAGSYTWTDPQTCVLSLCFLNAPFCPTITLQFRDDEVRYKFQENVTFGPKHNTNRPKRQAWLIGNAIKGM